MSSQTHHHVAASCNDGAVGIRGAQAECNLQAAAAYPVLLLLCVLCSVKVPDEPVADAGPGLEGAA